MEELLHQNAFEAKSSEHIIGPHRFAVRVSFRSRAVCGNIETNSIIGDGIELFSIFSSVMDPRKFLKRLARELGLMKGDTATQKKAEKVSDPVNFEHRVHVALDEDSGGFVGLPPQWKRMAPVRKPDELLYPESARTASRRNFTQRHREMLDDSALGDHTLSRTRTENFTHFAASLETPRSRASVADSQDLIIERLKRELRDYKARNSHAFEESTEDAFLSGDRYTTRNLSSASQTQFTNNRSSNNTFPRFSRNSHESDELDEDALFSNERSLKYNGNSALSSKSFASPAKHDNVNGSISRLFPTKLNGIKSNGNPRVLRRSESDV